MSTIELIGIIVGIIATIVGGTLGGVWFIINKAFNFGKTSHRIDKIDERTSHANCEAHKESIDKLEKNNLPQRVEILEEKTSNIKCESHEEKINELKGHNLPQRVGILENKTSSMKCESHDKSIELLKEQLNDSKYDFRKSVEELKNEIRDFKQETKETFASIKEELKEFKQETRENFAAINKDLSEFKQETRENIDNLRQETRNNTKQINILLNDVSSIKELLTHKHKDALKFFALKHSPLQLNDFGIHLIEEINGMDFIDKNKEYLMKRIDNDNPRTALDVETSAFMACIEYNNKEEFDYIKDFIYNSPEYKVKDKDGEDMRYDLSISDICFVLSIPLRDLYLSLHPEILGK